MEEAIDQDPDFAAPLIWRTPERVSSSSPEQLAEHRAELERLILIPSATSFELAMLRWALAHSDTQTGALERREGASLQVRHLGVALEHQPGNRIILLSLAAQQMNQGGMAEAWEILSPVVEKRWYHPAVYPMAARCAIALAEPSDARRVLKIGSSLQWVDPGTYALLALVAVENGDIAAERLYRSRYTRRMEELLPEEAPVDLSTEAEHLAQRAESRGRHEVPIF